jgi:hypothetical protein
MASAVIDTPIGVLGLVASDQSLQSVVFGGRGVRPEGRSAVLDETVAQLDSYFAGERWPWDWRCVLVGWLILIIVVIPILAIIGLVSIVRGIGRRV